jgi:5,6,7,8-tetrahydromethanopterin hydro-lyase
MGELLQIGEGFAGDGAEAAHVNSLLGRRDGPVATAWATALATPRPGHVAFVAVVQPGLAVQPPTLFVNKAALVHERHEQLTWGAAQAGVAAGVLDAVADGVIAAHEIGELVLIVAVWVHSDARDGEAVYLNNRAATRTALETGEQGLPHIEQVLAARGTPWNPYFELLRG